MSNVVNLQDWKNKKLSKDRAKEGYEDLHSVEQAVGNISDRVEKIRSSIQRINTLLADVKTTKQQTK